MLLIVTQLYHICEINMENLIYCLLKLDSWLRQSLLRRGITEVSIGTDDVWKVGDLVDWLTDGCFWTERLTEVFNDGNAVDFVTGVKTRQQEDTREVDDLAINLADTKGVKTSKKNHKKRKEQKRTSSCSASSYTCTEASTSNKIIEKKDEDVNASDSANHCGSSFDTLLSTRDGSFYSEEDAFYNYLDLALKEKDDRNKTQA
ncbi:hypothetical protein ACET3Z_003234 [Daucus carota]